MMIVLFSTLGLSVRKIKIVAPEKFQQTIAQQSNGTWGNQISIEAKSFEKKKLLAYRLNAESVTPGQRPFEMICNSE